MHFDADFLVSMPPRFLSSTADALFFRWPCCHCCFMLCHAAAMPPAADAAADLMILRCFDYFRR